MKNKKPNPGNQHFTGWDVKKAHTDGIVAGCKQTLKMCLYILLDKHEAPREEVAQFAKEVEWLAGHIDQGRLSWGDVDRVLAENGVGVRLR